MNVCSYLYCSTSTVPLVVIDSITLFSHMIHCACMQVAVCSLVCVCVCVCMCVH